MASSASFVLLLLACFSWERAHAVTMTRRSGAPVGDNQNSLTCGASGGTLLQDVHLIEKLANIARERIPDRIVHSRGAGAHGFFLSYDDHSNLTANPALSVKNKITPAFTRFSTFIHGHDSPETVRDPRGFATRLYTEAGNWDMVFNNLPIAWIRDAMKFPDLVHALKPDPVTNVQDPGRFFDFFSQIPESTKMITYLYSDQGIPANYRTMPGSSVHAYKFVNAAGIVKYVKMFWKPLQGVINFTAQQAAAVQAVDFSHATRDLYSAITAGNFPSWEFQIQVMDPSQLDSFDFNPLDPTKDWPESIFPKKTLGKLTLNRVPDNFHQFSEQFAPCPTNIVPGVEMSEDRTLQGRVFSYADAQRYRVGVNHADLPVNRPVTPAKSYTQGGAMDIADRKGTYNYEPNSDPNGYTEDPKYKFSKFSISGTYMQAGINKTLNFGQAGDLYRSFAKKDKDNLVSNLAGDLTKVKSAETRTRMVANFYKADPEYGSRVAAAISCDMYRVKEMADDLEE